MLEASSLLQGSPALLLNTEGSKVRKSPSVEGPEPPGASAPDINGDQERAKGKAAISYNTSKGDGEV